MIKTSKKRNNKILMIIRALRDFYWFLIDIRGVMERVARHARDEYKLMSELVLMKVVHMMEYVRRAFELTGISLGEKPDYETMRRQLGDISLEILDDVTLLADALKHGAAEEEIIKTLSSIREKLELTIGMSRLVLNALEDEKSQLSRSLAALVTSLRWDIGFILSLVEEELKKLEKPR